MIYCSVIYDILVGNIWYITLQYMIYYFMKECFRKQKRNVLASLEAASDGFPSFTLNPCGVCAVARKNKQGGGWGFSCNSPPCRLSISQQTYVAGLSCILTHAGIARFGLLLEQSLGKHREVDTPVAPEVAAVVLVVFVGVAGVSCSMVCSHKSMVPEGLSPCYRAASRGWREAHGEESLDFWR